MILALTRQLVVKLYIVDKRYDSVVFLSRLIQQTGKGPVDEEVSKDGNRPKQVAGPVPLTTVAAITVRCQLALARSD
jgi:hypothetical protein